MWKRKELKQKAKELIKNSYWSIIIVCFILAICTGEFGMSSIIIQEKVNTIDKNTNEILLNSEDLDEAIINKNEEILTLETEDFASPTKEILEAVKTNVNSATKSQQYILKIVDAIYLVSNNSIVKGVALFIGALLSFSFIVFVADPLMVGGRRFFLKVKDDKETKVGILISVFKSGQWGNITKIMFLRNIYTALWYLTIIGGIIKSYEYRMIPNILAQNPTIKTKEVFKLTKQMMKGNKWRTFVLDLSFLPWDILSLVTSVFTFNFLGILFVNPYIVATNTELYLFLKEVAIKEKYEYYEALEIDDNINDKNKKSE